MIESRSTRHYGIRWLAFTAAIAGLIQLGCAAQEEPEVMKEAIRQSHAPPAFVITDTTEWECGGNGGLLGTLLVNESYVDTVDISFGVQPLSDGYIFNPMRTEEDPVFGPFICPTAPVLYDGAQRVPLAELLPFFNDYFSNPTAHETAVYYWGFDEGSLYAMRYTITNEGVDKTFLTDDPNLLATGNRYHFLPPALEGQQVVFPTWPGRTFYLNTELELLADSVVQR